MESITRTRSAWQFALALSFGIFVVALIVSVFHNQGKSVVWLSLALCCLLNALAKLIFKDRIYFRGMSLDFHQNPKSYWFYVACCVAIASLALNKVFDGLG